MRQGFGQTRCELRLEFLVWKADSCQCNLIRGLWGYFIESTRGVNVSGGVQEWFAITVIFR